MSARAIMVRAARLTERRHNCAQQRIRLTRSGFQQALQGSLVGPLGMPSQRSIKPKIHINHGRQNLIAGQVVCHATSMRT